MQPLLKHLASIDELATMADRSQQCLDGVGLSGPAGALAN